ncbi:polymerase-associated protein [Ceratitis capitata sigmavirus]|uniref:Polymerase-associated protein n=1 Tax=Ceratitis capitata sigmavirus TaxID=1802949 RepID=A0A140D8P3_9RHAB|nr:polymerase-associated protein [Ceratitis capitata sigmavirus]AMK09267.1 polymerase-associated protein [Ceratitis capitata sigmavirus]
MDQNTDQLATLNLANSTIKTLKQIDNSGLGNQLMDCEKKATIAPDLPGFEDDDSSDADELVSSEVLSLNRDSDLEIASNKFNESQIDLILPTSTPNSTQDHYKMEIGELCNQQQLESIHLGLQNFLTHIKQRYLVHIPCPQLTYRIGSCPTVEAFHKLMSSNHDLTHPYLNSTEVPNTQKRDESHNNPVTPLLKEQAQLVANPQIASNREILDVFKTGFYLNPLDSKNKPIKISCNTPGFSESDILDTYKDRLLPRDPIIVLIHRLKKLKKFRLFEGKYDLYTINIKSHANN